MDSVGERAGPCEGSSTVARPSRATSRGAAPLVLGTLLALACLALAPGAQAAAPTEIHFTVQMGEYWFSPAYIAVDVNTTVNITLVNAGAAHHEFEILGYGVDGHAGPGENATITFVANRTGTYTILCGIPGHSTQGMVGRLIVVGPGFDLNPVPQVAGEMIHVLEAVEEEYAAANVSGGAAQNEVEYNESRDFLAAAQDLWASIEADAAALDDSGAAKVSRELANLSARVQDFAPHSEVKATVDEIIHELEEIGAATPANANLGWQEHLARLRADLVQVVSEYKAGRAAQADTLLGEAYLEHVEPLEKALAGVDPALKERMEKEIIVDLRGLIRSAAPPASVDAKWADINATLGQVEVKLAPPAASGGPWFALGLMAGLTVGAVVGVLAFALYIRRATRAPPARPPAAREGSREGNP